MDQKGKIVLNKLQFDYLKEKGYLWTGGTYIEKRGESYYLWGVYSADSYGPTSFVGPPRR